MMQSTLNETATLNDAATSNDTVYINFYSVHKTIQSMLNDIVHAT